MIELPNFNKAFEYENNFYLSCDSTRIAKLLAHYELYKMTLDIPGAVVECGVFKGTSLTRFTHFRNIFSHSFSKKIIGFDIFGKFPETQFEEDKTYRDKFISNAGDESISIKQLKEVLKRQNNIDNIELIQGDICATVPQYVKTHPELKISLLNLDTDIYEPAVTILEHLFPRINQGGILMIDDYGVFPGETKAVDDYFYNTSVQIKKFPFCMTPSYVIKS
jgi:hypothetical protein